MTEEKTSLKFYTDTHIAKAVAVQLRNRGIDVVRCEEVDMAEAGDTDHLEYATGEKRVLVTQDSDFARLHVEWQRSGKTHYGVMILPKHLQGESQISYAVRELVIYHDMIDNEVGTIADDIEDHLIWL